MTDLSDREAIRAQAQQKIRDTNLTTHALVCLTPPQKEELQARAHAKGMGLSTYIRWFLFQE